MPAFNLEPLVRAGEKDIIPAIKAAIPKVIDAIKKPSFPSAEGTTAAELASKFKSEGKPVRPFAPEVSTQGRIPEEQMNPLVEAAVAQTYDPQKAIWEQVRDLKTFAAGFFDQSPNTPPDYKKISLAARERINKAPSVAALDLSEMLKPLTDPKLGDVNTAAHRATLVARQMLTADTIKQMERDGVSSLHGQSLDAWKKSNEALNRIIANDQGMFQASQNLRGGLNEMFNDMVQRGWISEDRYLESYTPVQKINAVVSALAHMTNESENSLRSRVLGATKHRGEISDLSIREGNLIKTLHGLRAEYYSKVAQHEMFNEIVASPWNLTSQFKEGQTLPRGVAAYNPGPGQMGYLNRSPEGQFIAGALQALDPTGRLNSGSYIFPEQLVKALNSFHPTPHHEYEKPLVDAGRAISKSVTVYNVANTQLNRGGDLLVALTGMPGEKARPMGVLRFYGTAHKAAQEFVRGGMPMVNINGQPVELGKLLINEGVSSSTFFKDVSGQDVSSLLSKFTPESEQANPTWMQQLKEKFQTEREAVELTPRIAAGLEALERTGDVKEFGRVARNITLNFNAAAPQASQVPVIKFMAPFAKFTGLATKRVFDLLAAKDSRGRVLAGVIAVPTATMMWNYQNQEYQDVEHSLAPYERDQLHIILPDLRDISKPLYDATGKPVVIRVRYYLPEEVAKMVGLGNLASRVRRVAEGRDTPVQFLKQSANAIPNTVAEMLAIPKMFNEATTGKSDTGKELDIPERIIRLLPSLRIPQAAVTAYMSEGATPAESAMAAAGAATEELLGLRFASAQHKQGYILDADVTEAKKKLMDAKAKVRYIATHGPASEMQSAYDELYAARDNALRIEKAYKEEQEDRGSPTRKVETPEFTQRIRLENAKGREKK